MASAARHPQRTQSETTRERGGGASLILFLGGSVLVESRVAALLPNSTLFGRFIGITRLSCDVHVCGN